jgi:hypothetical protein
MHRRSFLTIAAAATLTATIPTTPRPLAAQELDVTRTGQATLGDFHGAGAGWVIGARRPGGPGAPIWRLVRVPDAP